MRLLVLLAASLPALAQTFPSSGLDGFGWCSQLSHCKQIPLYSLNLSTGTVDIQYANAGAGYTPAVGKRALIVRWQLWQNGNSPTCTPYIKIGGVTYVQVIASGAVGVGGGLNQLATPFVLEHNDILALNCSVAGVNVYSTTYEFDASANAPVTKYLNMTAGATTTWTIMTVSPGRVFGPLFEIGATGSIASNNICTYMNSTGSAQSNVSIYYVPNLGTAGTGNLAYFNPNINNNVRADTPPAALNSGDSIVLTTPAVGMNNQFMWCTGVEMPQ